MKPNVIEDESDTDEKSIDDSVIDNSIIEIANDIENELENREIQPLVNDKSDDESTMCTVEEMDWDNHMREKYVYDG